MKFDIRVKVGLLLLILVLNIGIMAKNNIHISKYKAQKVKKTKRMERMETQKTNAYINSLETVEGVVMSPIRHNRYPEGFNRESEVKATPTEVSEDSLQNLTGTVGGLSNTGIQFSMGFIVKLLKNEFSSWVLKSDEKTKLNTIMNGNCKTAFISIYNQICGSSKRNDIKNQDSDWIRKAAELIQQVYKCFNDLTGDMVMEILTSIVSIAVRVFAGILTFGISEIVRVTVKAGIIASCAVDLYRRLTNGKWNYYKIGRSAGCVAINLKELIAGRKRKHKMFRKLSG